jgi:DNA-binding LytR/AlgR family response regulator
MLVVISKVRQVDIVANRFWPHSRLAGIAFASSMDISFPPRTSHSPEAASIEPQQWRHIADLRERLPLLQKLAWRRPRRIAIKAKGKIVFVDPAHVIAVEARENEIWLEQRSGSYPLRESISSIARKLSAQGFVRIHRSVLVNAALVKEIRPRLAGEYVLSMQGGKEYTVTRTYKKNLNFLAESWIGVSGFAADFRT